MSNVLIMLIWLVTIRTFKQKILYILKFMNFYSNWNFKLSRREGSKNYYNKSISRVCKYREKEHSKDIESNRKTKVLY